MEVCILLAPLRHAVGRVGLYYDLEEGGGEVKSAYQRTSAWKVFAWRGPWVSEIAAFVSNCFSKSDSLSPPLKCVNLLWIKKIYIFFSSESQSQRWMGIIKGRFVAWIKNLQNHHNKLLLSLLFCADRSPLILRTENYFISFIFLCVFCKITWAAFSISEHLNSLQNLIVWEANELGVNV